MIRVLVVEDQKIMQKYFEYMLSQESEFKHDSDSCRCGGGGRNLQLFLPSILF